MPYIASEKILKLNDPPKVVAFSSDKSPTVINAFKEIGVHDFLLKPVDEKVLISFLQKY